MERSACFCALLFAASLFVLPALANVALVSAGLLMLSRPRAACERLRGHPLWLPLGLALAYLAAHLFWQALAVGHVPPPAREEALDLLKYLLLVPVAWVVAGRPQRARWMLALAGAGLVVQVLMQVPWGELASLHASGRRADFGFTSVAAGLYCAAGLLGVLVLVPAGTWAPGRSRGAVLVAAAVAVAVLTAALLLSRSRGAWLALLLALPLCLSGGWLMRRSLRPVQAVLGLCMVAVLLAGGESVARRVVDDAPAYRALIETVQADDEAAAERAWGEIPHDSVGLRLHLWRLALDSWRQAPLLGHGLGVHGALIAGSPDPGLHHLVHLHSIYLDLAVRLGVVGLLLAVALPGSLALGLRRAARDGLKVPDLLRFLFGILVLTAVWSLFDSRLFKLDFRLYAALLAGIALGLAVPRRRHACAS